jgi:DNA invertase Pin-like site-specific DNA recombinase
MSSDKPRQGHSPRQRASRLGARTKAALAAAKARGVKLGGPKLAQARKVALETIGAAADNHAANVLPIIREIKRAGATTLREIAEAPNARGVACLSSRQDVAD